MMHHDNRVSMARRALARLGDAELAAIAEAAIDLLDERHDPDEDLCPAGDDGCGPFIGAPGRGESWGSVWEGLADIALIPDYGPDQRIGRTPYGTYRVE